MYVQFAQVGPVLSWQNTSPLPIVPGKSTNFIVAGMLPNTTYVMRDVLDDGTVSAPVAFTTGSLPANVNFPSFTVVQPPAAGTDLSQGVIFHSAVLKGKSSANTANTLATATPTERRSGNGQNRIAGCPRRYLVTLSGISANIAY